MFIKVMSKYSKFCGSKTDDHVAFRRNKPLAADMLKKWCEVTSCNGVIDLYESRNTKLAFGFWMIIVLLGLSVSLWSVYRTINDYVKTPFVTNVELITASNLTMPDVMACYMGGLNVSSMEKEGFDETFITMFTVALADSLYAISLSEQYARYQQNYLESVAKPVLIEYLKSHKISLLEFVEKFSYNCEDVVEFFRHPFMGVYTCNQTKRLVDGRSGQCFIFSNIEKQYYPDNRGGITMELKQPDGSFYKIMNPTEDSYYGYMSDGFSLTLEESIGLQRTGRQISIPMNVRAEITLNPKRYVRTPGSGKCSSSGKLYSSNSCFYNCYVNSVAENCGCFLLNYFDQNQFNDTFPVCSPFEHVYKCNQDDHRACQRKCLPKCDEWVFDSMVSFTIDTHTVNRSMVSIAYQTMQYTKITKVASFSIDMAIANVGGQFGLWIGASIITFIQAAFYFCIGCFRKFKGKYRISSNTDPLK